jgi:hypothetical protein
MYVNLFKTLGFAKIQPIPEDARWDEAKEAFESVFRGKALNAWTCSHASRQSFVTANKIIVKFCRANALLPWLMRNFDFNYAPILLIRHPFAIAASKLEWGGWNYDFSGYAIPDCRFNEYYLKHKDFLSKIRTKEEAFVAEWCLQNLVCLRHARNNIDWITVYYECLLMNPEEEIQRIFDRWRLPMPDDIFDRIGKSSGTTKEATFKQGAEKQLGKWKLSFSREQLKRMAAVLEYFGADQYSMDVFPKAVA